MINVSQLFFTIYWVYMFHVKQFLVERIFLITMFHVKQIVVKKIGYTIFGIFELTVKIDVSNIYLFCIHAIYKHMNYKNSKY